MTTTLLFDLDGTLINTNPLIIASFTHTLDKYFPGEYSEEDIIAFIGEPLEDSFKKVDEARIEELVEEYRTHNIAHHDELVEEYPGVFETIKALKEKGYKIGIVTTKRRRTVEMGLKLTGLDQFFDVVVPIDDVENPKPDPEPIDKALEMLGGDRDHAYMVGDSPHDIQAGKNAGVKTIGVSWSVKGRARIEEESPDFIIDEMPEILEIAEAEDEKENSQI